MRNYCHRVLIETYWNVKDEIQHLIKCDLSINRNILECKVKEKFLISRKPVVLIETYWNVKKAVIASVTISETRINRNILECKELSGNAIRSWSAGINRNILECKDRRQYDGTTLPFCINRNILECKDSCL